MVSVDRWSFYTGGLYDRFYCTCICTCVCVYVNICTHVHAVHMRTYVRMCIGVFAYTYICKYVCINMTICFLDV